MEAGDNRCMELQRCLERTKDTDEVELIIEEVVARKVDEVSWEYFSNYPFFYFRWVIAWMILGEEF